MLQNFQDQNQERQAKNGGSFCAIENDTIDMKEDGTDGKSG